MNVVSGLKTITTEEDLQISRNIQPHRERSGSPGPVMPALATQFSLGAFGH